MRGKPVSRLHGGNGDGPRGESILTYNARGLAVNHLDPSPGDIVVRSDLAHHPPSVLNSVG